MKTKKTKLAVILSASLFLFTPFSTVSAHSEHCEIKETELGETMKHMKSELRAYVKGFKAEDPDKMQRHLNELLQLSEKANKLTPVTIMQMGHDDSSEMDHSAMVAMSEMDHSQMIHGVTADMTEMDHSKMGHGEMTDMDSQDHDMSKMPSMAGMSNEQHHQHMKYMQGMTELQGLFKQLNTTKERTEIKKILGAVKQHSKKSHHSFRQNCD